MALILSLETSAANCSVALHNDDQLLKFQEIREPQVHAAKLAGLISKLSQETGTTPNELKAVAISAGPGSYTGLRIGTSTAKGICYALNIPLIAVPTLDLLAFQFIKLQPVTDALLCPMIDARRMEVYCQVMTAGREIVRPVEAVEIDHDSFAELLKDHKLFFFGDGAEKCKNIVGNNTNAFFIDEISPEASSLGEMAFANYKKRVFEDLTAFAPFYLKDFVAKKAKPVF